METSNLRPITDTERKEILGKPFQAPEHEKSDGQGTDRP